MQYWGGCGLCLSGRIRLSNSADLGTDGCKRWILILFCLAYHLPQTVRSMSRWCLMELGRVGTRLAEHLAGIPHADGYEGKTLSWVSRGGDSHFSESFL